MLDDGEDTLTARKKARSTLMGMSGCRSHGSEAPICGGR